MFSICPLSKSTSPAGAARLIWKRDRRFLTLVSLMTFTAIEKHDVTTYSLLIRRCATVGLLGLVGACATVDPDKSVSTPAAPDVVWLSALPVKDRSVTWQHRAFPGKKQTDYRATLHEGRQAVRSESSAAASMLRQTVRVEPADLGKVSFSWKVPALIANADMTQAETSDSPVRLVLAFEGDRSKFSAKNSMVSELALALTGEPLPYATLMYVWGTHRAPGSIIHSHRTDRIRKLVLESGPQHLGRWLDYERDIKADFEKAFGEAPGALVGVGIMTDTDNTGGQTQAWYGPVSLQASQHAAAPAPAFMAATPRVGDAVPRP
jgi:Protein of unknown function (DUF3047)